MNPQIIEEMLDELDPIFQNTDASAGIVRLLKEKGVVNDHELAPYLEQAATAGSIKWRATRLRLARLLESAVKSIEEELSEKQKKALEEARAAEQHPQRSRGRRPSAKTANSVDTQELNQGKSGTTPAPAPVAAPGLDQGGSAGTSKENAKETEPHRQPVPETADAKKSGPDAKPSAESERRPA